MNVVFVASVAVVASDPPNSRKLFTDALGLPLQGEGDGYYSSGSIPGSKHFGVWPLSQAAEACFGTPEWPDDRVVPQASIEFEVESAEAVADRSAPACGEVCQMRPYASLPSPDLDTSDISGTRQGLRVQIGGGIRTRDLRVMRSPSLVLSGARWPSHVG